MRLCLASIIVILTSALALGPALAQSPMFIVAPPGSIVVDCGGSITTGGTAQQLFKASQIRNGFWVEVGANDSNTDPIYFADGPTTKTPGAGVAGSASLAPSTSSAPGGSFLSPINYPIGVDYYINGATTGDRFKCRVW